MEQETSQLDKTGVLRTIITKAVYGRTTQACQATIYINTNENKKPTQVLGCTVTNAQIDECGFEGLAEDKVDIRVNGKFEIHVWYEVDNDTYVAKSHAKFSEIIPIPSSGGETYRNKQILAWICKSPTALETMVVNKVGSPVISVQIAYELSVEVIGEAKLNIISYPLTKDQKEQEESLLLSSMVLSGDKKTGD